MNNLIDLFYEAKEDNPDLKLLGLTVSKIDRRISIHRPVLQELVKKYKVIEVIKYSEYVRLDLEKGLPVAIVEPSSEVAKQYIELSERIVK